MHDLRPMMAHGSVRDARALGKACFHVGNKNSPRWPYAMFQACLCPCCSRVRVKL